MATASKTLEKIEVLPLAEIEADYTWNARGNVEASADGPDGKMGFEGLKKSIALTGQDEPVVVRANTTKGSRKPWSLVAGFRRYAAISQIANETGDKAPSIKAIVKVLNEAQARDLNVRENTARDDLSGPDLAFGVQKMFEADATLTDTALAERLGMSQAYISKLHRIVDNAKAQVLKDWRADTIKLTVDQVLAISKLPKDEQADKYKEVLRGKENPAGARGKNAWVDTAQKGATKAATMLGTLVREGLVTVDDEDSLFSPDHIRTLVEFKADATENQVAKIIGSAEKAFKAALEEPEAGTESDEPKKGGTKAKKNSSQPVAEN